VSALYEPGPERVGRHPNVLVITADDMRADDLRWMPQTRRQIAATGLRFRNSFAPNPLCCPARASFLTGTYSHNHRVLSHEKPYGFGAFDDSRTLATVLRRAGYRTAMVGKYLNGYGEQPTHVGHHDSLHYVPPGWSQWWGSTDHHWRPGEKPGGGTYNYTHLTSVVNGQLRSYPGRYTTDVTSQQTRALVQRFGSIRPRSPWFIWWTPVAPHFGGPAEPDDPGTVRRPDGYPVPWGTPARPGRAEVRARPPLHRDHAWARHRRDPHRTLEAGPVLHR
jgi:arylsulfatase A-like enzyme